MSQLAKALKNLETRGTAFAPASQSPLPPAPAPLPPVAEPAPIVAGAASFAPVKPRPAARIRPRRAIQSPSDPPPPQPILKSLAAPRVETALADPKASPPPPPELAAVRENYVLSPAMVVNQSALEAGAALAREMATESCDAAAYLDVVPEVVVGPTGPATTRAAAPARMPTLFEHRIRESLVHPARSRPFAELVQRLRQDFRGREQNSLLFTGIGPASRGDEMLAHVAALFAEQGDQILLVDADFERAGLTAGFGAGTLSGLQNVIANPASWREHLLPTSFPGLTVLPTGRGNIKVNFAADAISKLLPQMGQIFPLVLIDGGQSSGSLVTPLASICDATYLVIRLGTTDAKEAQSALRGFRAAGARVMGCVATMDGAWKQ